VNESLYYIPTRYNLCVQTVTTTPNPSTLNPSNSNLSSFRPVGNVNVNVNVNHQHSESKHDGDNADGDDDTDPGERIANNVSDGQPPITTQQAVTLMEEKEVDPSTAHEINQLLSSTEHSN